MIKLCTRCIYLDTKPDLFLDEDGVCSACRSFESRGEVDWASRRTEFKNLIARYRRMDGVNYDCIVPVSGGKDSTSQVILLLELDINPLCVTASTDSLSDIGRRNIENIKRLGVDYLEMTTNPIVRRKNNRFCLTEIGDISWPEHVSIFTIPIRFAAKLGVPLITWGENSQHAGAGEILLTSIDCDGTMEGYDTELIASVASAVSVPVVASGGAGGYTHMAEALEAGASAVAASSIYHFTEMTPLGTKTYLRERGFPVRL